MYDLAEEFGWQKPKGKTAHRALEDCLAQRRVLVDALKYLRGGGAMRKPRLCGPIGSRTALSEAEAGP